MIIISVYQAGSPAWNQNKNQDDKRFPAAGQYEKKSPNQPGLADSRA